MRVDVLSYATSSAMRRYVLLAASFAVVCAPPVPVPAPLRVTIDCVSEEQESSLFDSPLLESEEEVRPGFSVDSFCELVQSAIPRGVQEGSFLLVKSEGDQRARADTQRAVSVSPPRGLSVPKLGMSRVKLPRLRIPKLKVPTLTPLHTATGAPRLPPLLARSRETGAESSAERLERFKKGVQKMLRVVKVLGQVDDYLSKRTRIVVDKLAKTFSE